MVPISDESIGGIAVQLSLEPTESSAYIENGGILNVDRVEVRDNVSIITSTGGIVLGSVTAGSTVTLEAQGANADIVDDGDKTVDVFANKLYIVDADKVSDDSAGNDKPIETAVNELQLGPAVVLAGGTEIDIKNTGDLEVVTASDVGGVGDDYYRLVTSGTLTVNTTINLKGAGADTIILEATNGNIDVNESITAGTSVALTAGGSITDDDDGTDGADISTPRLTVSDAASIDFPPMSSAR